MKFAPLEKTQLYNNLNHFPFRFILLDNQMQEIIHPCFHSILPDPLLVLSLYYHPPFTISDVVVNVVVEEYRILRHYSNGLPQRALRDIPHVLAVQ